MLKRSGSRRILAGQTAEAQQLTAEEEALIERFPATIRREVRRLARSSRRPGRGCGRFSWSAVRACLAPGAIVAASRGVGAHRDRGTAEECRANARFTAVAEEAAAGSVCGAARNITDDRDICPADRCAAALNAEESAFWLASIAFGARAANEDFAVWLAEQPLFDETDAPERLFGILAAYAWYSTALGTRAHQLIVVPWRPEIALDTAVCAAKSWFNRMRLVMQLGQGVLSDTWLEGGTVNGYTIHPLIKRTARRSASNAKRRPVLGAAIARALPAILDPARRYPGGDDGNRAASARNWGAGDRPIEGAP